ncbi:MAG: RagB/SusD family nutrient uptake outer membrane protein [Weeksellaceae bacterium]|nr:RagB/SusD family nutrient uptake outer membrane protein [Weeksellaceae bacterium]
MALLSASVFGFVACNDSNLEDVQNLGAFDTNNYYKTESQCFAGVVATYDLMRKYAGGFENMVTFFNAGSDDFYSGGGSSGDGAGIQGFSNYTINGTIMPRSYWTDFYQGIARANIVIQKVPDAEISQATKNRFIAEAKVLRSLYYFELLRMFKNVPLILVPIKTSDDYYHIPQADPAAVYAQIEQDIVASISALPMTVTGVDRGRMTQGSARAILGKIYLYDKKMNLAAEQLAQVNGTPGQLSQYGYKLLANYGDLWKVDNKFTTEAIVEVMHTNQSLNDWSFWGTGKDEGNTVCIMTGLRSYNKIASDVPDLVSGWSFNPMTEDLFNNLQNDPRAGYTIFNAKDLMAGGKITYTPGYKDTGYFLKKYLPYTADKSSLPGATELNFRQNYILIRLADSYLMEAEALGGTGARAQALLDAVRSRVGLASVPVSMQAIKDERRKELAGEGHRWFDLVRWGDAPAKLGTRGFTTGKNEVMPIPFDELSNTSIKQNPNYN